MTAVEGGALDVREEIATILSSVADASPKTAFAALGSKRLFAPHFPTSVGGRGGSLGEYVAVAEALGDRDLADVAHLVTVQGVASTLLRFCSDEQVSRWVPELASGTALASLLFSERHAGTDASAMRTVAERHGDGWRIRGEKCWGLYTDWSRYGLCSARTSPATRNRYAGISVFLLELDAEGVTLSASPRSGSPYFTVELEDVFAPTSAVVGAVDRGWQVITAAAGHERAGFDYLCRGRRWLHAAEEALELLPRGASAQQQATIARLEHDLCGARALALETVEHANGFEFDDIRSAYSKYASGEAAQAVARFIAEDVLPMEGLAETPDLVERLTVAALEGPELTISGNPRDVLLDTLAADPFLGAA